VRLLALAAAWMASLPASAEVPLAERVAALEATYGVVLRPPASADEGLVAEVEAGLAALPPALRHPPGGPLELELHAESSPLGLGDGTVTRPEWTEGRQRFQLYRYAPPKERRATFRLSRLTDTEAERLWRRRAVVHAVVQRWDDARGWSNKPRWRRLSGWHVPLEHLLTSREEALLSYAGAFSRARGQVSASLDLVTFAEELFVPVESLRPEALSADDQVRCQEFSKARALAESITEDGLGSLPERGRCPAFDTWADEESLSHFEVLMAAASGRQPESLFGHLMLRPVWREGAVPRGPAFEPVVQLVALTGLEARGLQYTLKGLLGGYDTAFLTTTMAEISHETMELEQRSVRRFQLRLTASEQVRLLERVWELERRGYFPYRFFTDNCASALIFLLNGVLEGGRKVRMPGRLWVAPAATLDMLSLVKVEAPGGASQMLLEYIPDDFESTEARAARADASREEALAELSSSLPPEARARLRLLHWRLRSSNPEVRRATYAGMPEVIAGLIHSVPSEKEEEVRRLLHAYMAWSVRVERGAADRAEAEKLAVERERVLALRTRFPTAAEGVRDRQKLFEREDELQRHLAVLDRISLLQEALARAPRRPPTAEEAQILKNAEAAEATFIASTEAQGALQEGTLASVDPVAFLAEDRRQKMEVRTRLGRGSLGEIGCGPDGGGVGCGLPRDGAGAASAHVRVGGTQRGAGRCAPAWLPAWQRAARAGGRAVAPAQEGAAPGDQLPVHSAGLPHADARAADSSALCWGCARLGDGGADGDTARALHTVSRHRAGRGARGRHGGRSLPPLHGAGSRGEAGNALGPRSPGSSPGTPVVALAPHGPARLSCQCRAPGGGVRPLLAARGWHHP